VSGNVIEVVMMLISALMRLVRFALLGGGEAALMQ